MPMRTFQPWRARRRGARTGVEFPIKAGPVVKLRCHTYGAHPHAWLGGL